MINVSCYWLIHFLIGFKKESIKGVDLICSARLDLIYDTFLSSASTSKVPRQKLTLIDKYKQGDHNIYLL